uniref:Uncharacterized protein n=1 Tax=Rhizophora mucronata TaxID=61149 RepID=A0A2P2NK58_RHIMU
MKLIKENHKGSTPRTEHYILQARITGEIFEYN